MRLVLPLSFGVLLAACAAPDLGAPTAADGQAAEQFATTAIETQFPGYTHGDEVATCVLSSATDDEIMILSGQTGPATEKDRTTLAVAVAQRPATRTCLANNNVPPLG